VTTGVKHIKFWKIVGATCEGKKGVTGGKGEITSHLCGAFGVEPGEFFSGGSNGHIYCWAGSSLLRTVSAHTGPVFTICALGEGFISGGKDGFIVLWNADCTEKLKEYEIKCENVAEDSHGILIKGRC
jgi:WD40 repeat protein